MVVHVSYGQLDIIRSSYINVLKVTICCLTVSTIGQCTFLYSVDYVRKNYVNVNSNTMDMCNVDIHEIHLCMYICITIGLYY